MFSSSNPSLEKIRYYSNYFMVLVYLFLGALFFFTDIGINTFPSYRKEIGCTMMIYGAIRTLMTYRKNKREKNEHQG